jgi:hypothetical protein
MLPFITERQIRERAKTALLDKAKQEEAQAKEEHWPDDRRKYTADALRDPAFELWVREIVVEKMRAGLLVSDQQYADLKVGRRLQEGDRARFIGETRVEGTKLGRNYTRPRGQEGKIVTAVLSLSDKKYVYTFLPDVPLHARDPDGPEFFVATCEFRESTTGALAFERIPPANEERKVQ